MKRLRGIHLFFIMLTIGMIVFFWVGFSFGKETQRQEDLVLITEANLSIENESEEDILSKISDERYTIETGLEYAKPMFYIKQTGDYLSVYVYATDELYFETDIVFEELPVELQEDTQEGIEFTDLEAVYTFLENYSS